MIWIALTLPPKIPEHPLINSLCIDTHLKIDSKTDVMTEIKKCESLIFIVQNMLKGGIIIHNFNVLYKNLHESTLTEQNLIILGEQL